MDVSLKIPQRISRLARLLDRENGDVVTSCLLAISAMISALAAETMPPKPDRYFNDYAGVVDQATASELNEQLAQFERDTSTQIRGRDLPHDAERIFGRRLHPAHRADLGRRPERTQ